MALKGSAIGHSLYVVLPTLSQKQFEDGSFFKTHMVYSMFNDRRHGSIVLHSTGRYYCTTESEIMALVLFLVGRRHGNKYRDL
jgi:hypothetical protein